MASRRARCGGCGVHLQVSPAAQAIRCPRCTSVTRLPPLDAARTPAVVPNSDQGNGLLPYAQRPRPQLAPRSPPGHGRCRKALLIGVNYVNRSYSLKGSINDVKSMRALLIQRFGFPSSSILVLTEKEMDPQRIPTKQNIRKAMQWLVQGCQPGDSLLLHYSGHGSRQKDFSHDELDGFDEAICPLDHETEGLIIDDEINATIVRPLPPGVTLHALVDTCHSGTVLDLPYLCRMNREGYYAWQSQYRKPPHVDYRGTRGGLAICISACDDSETSGDTTAFTGSDARTGAMTSSFVGVLQNEPGGLTYGGLLNAMRQIIRENRPGAQPNAPIEAQEPQLSSSSKFEIYSKPLMI